MRQQHQPHPSQVSLFLLEYSAHFCINQTRCLNNLDGDLKVRGPNRERASPKEGPRIFKISVERNWKSIAIPVPRSRSNLYDKSSNSLANFIENSPNSCIFMCSLRCMYLQMHICVQYTSIYTVCYALDWMVILMEKWYLIGNLQYEV